MTIIMPHECTQLLYIADRLSLPFGGRPYLSLHSLYHTQTRPPALVSRLLSRPGALPPAPCPATYLTILRTTDLALVDKMVQDAQQRNAPSRAPGLIP